jgi:hypothetical protein
MELPETPVVVAGGVGGPLVMFTVTPARNALTLGATNSSASMASLYGQVFSKGFARGWTGGLFPATAACPTFICLGPAYHMFAGFAGVPAAVVIASCMESCIMFGAETANAQLAKNEKAPGTFKTTQPLWKPWGPGISIHILRNVLATAGLRMFCKPCTSAIEAVTGTSNGMTQAAGDFSGNVVSACMTAPIHQLYGFVATTPELRTASRKETSERMTKFLKDQYLVTEGGKTRLSSTVPRDLSMRSFYVATLYTMYVTLERALVNNWPR